MQRPVIPPFSLFSSNIQPLRSALKIKRFSRTFNYTKVFTMETNISESRARWSHVREARVADENRLGPNRAEGEEPTPTASSIRLAPRKAGRRMWEHHLPPLTPRPVTRDAPTHYYESCHYPQPSATTPSVSVFQRRIKVTPFKLIRIFLVPSNPFSHLSQRKFESRHRL